MKSLFQKLLWLALFAARAVFAGINVSTVTDSQMTSPIAHPTNTYQGIFLDPSGAAITAGGSSSAQVAAQVSTNDVQNVFNFKNYTTNDDGATDVSKDLQKLVNTAPNGATIYIPKPKVGRWQWTNSIFLKSSINIVGADVPSAGGNESIRFTGAGAAFKFTNAVNDVSIQNLKVLGNGKGAGQIGITTSGDPADLTANVRLSELSFISFGRVAQLTNYIAGYSKDFGGSDCADGINSTLTAGAWGTQVYFNGGTGATTASNSVVVNGGDATFVAPDCNSTNSTFKITSGKAIFLNANAEGSGKALALSNSGVAIWLGGRMGNQTYSAEVSDNSTFYFLNPLFGGIGSTFGGLSFPILSHSPEFDDIYDLGQRGRLYFVTNQARGLFHPVSDIQMELHNTGLYASLISEPTSTNDWLRKWFPAWDTGDHFYQYLRTNTVSGSPKFMLYDWLQPAYDKLSGLTALTTSSNLFSRSQTMVETASGSDSYPLELVNLGGANLTGAGVRSWNTAYPNSGLHSLNFVISGHLVGPNYGSEVDYYANGDANGNNPQKGIVHQGTNNAVELPGGYLGLTSRSTAPIPRAGIGFLWSSNSVSGSGNPTLYWVTPVKTNLVAAGF